MFDTKAYNKKYFKKHKNKIRSDARKYYKTHKDDPVFQAKKQLDRDMRHFGVPRSTIMRKTKGKCYYCKSKADDIHHLADDGRAFEKHGKKPNFNPDNLVPICKACHIDVHRAKLTLSRRLRASGFWAKKYDRCIECGTSETPHCSHGRCDNCNARHRRKVRKGAGV